ncbi:MAG TPA: aminotransferase class I/II-fold pyridoxal phosphate-dependent enzyme [Polyangiaceae bacterium]|nr:aminotransferase class I/II-fold pyridoxal phosphate-dependent enzyme [Polyangiaceae bacterium]
MKKQNLAVDIVDQIVSDGVDRGILHLYTEDEQLVGNTITLRGKTIVNFGSCSYLGLEFDRRLKDAAKAAIDRYGTQFSESRSYVSAGPYRELESLLEQIFEQPCVVASTTSLGHLSCIPVLVAPNDAIVMDQQVHDSVQRACRLATTIGTHLEVVRHNRCDLLERKLEDLCARHPRVWYMADGTYSMYGDTAPMNDIYALLDSRENFHLYIDDSHGMSIAGKHGRGRILDGRAFHRKMVLAASLNKAFAAGGGVLVFPDRESARKVRTCGGPMITSGPMQPSQLGAAIASARIHLSPELEQMQHELRERLEFTRDRIREHGLPLVSAEGAALFFIGVGLPKVGYNIIRRLLERGFYTNLAIFPAVPMRNTGVRFTVTRLHTFEQIAQLVAAIAEELPRALSDEQSSFDEVYRAFHLARPAASAPLPAPASDGVDGIRLTHATSIRAFAASEWDGLFGGHGFDSHGLKLLEESFRNNDREEYNCEFDYIVVRDARGLPIVAGFFTRTRWKDDMLAPAALSALVERERATDPYFLTSRVLSCGSLVTEGPHLYIARSSPLWKVALSRLLEKLSYLSGESRVDTLVFRDFYGEDPELDRVFLDHGFFKFDMPETNVLDLAGISSIAEWHARLSTHAKRNFRVEVRRHRDKFDAEFVTAATGAELRYWYELYENVRRKNLGLNTFALPFRLFEKILLDDRWDKLVLRLRPEFDHLQSNTPVCFVFAYRSAETYVPTLIGLDYRYNAEYKVYKQAVYRTVLRAMELGSKRVLLGFSASTDKRKVGARAVKTYGYMQGKDGFNFDVLRALEVRAKAAPGSREAVVVAEGGTT